MAYPHTLRIFVPGAGDFDGDDVFTQGPDSVVYNDGADFQDEGDRREVQRQDGEMHLERVGRAFLEDETKIGDVELGMKAQITFGDGSTQSGEVVEVRLLDGSVLLAWVE